MIELERRLSALGDALELDDGSVLDAVMTRLDATSGSADRVRRHRTLRAAAVLLIVVTAVVVAVPSARRTVAGWLGFDGVRVERDIGLVVPSTAPPVGVDAGLPAPGATEVRVVGGVEVLVSTIDGRIADGTIVKTVGDGSDVVSVDVAGGVGIWFGGAPHELIYRSGGEVLVERIAGNTLVWQDGDVIRRVEGFPSLDDALAFAVGP